MANKFISREEYLKQKRQEIIDKSLENSNNRVLPTVPYLPKYQNEKEWRDIITDSINSRKDKIKKYTFDDLINDKKIYEKEQLLNELKSLEQELSKGFKNELCAGASCIYTATDNYGKKYRVSGNQTFRANPSKYGFVEIGLNEIAPGDIIQDFKGIGTPVHAITFVGYDDNNKALFNYSKGGSEARSIVNNGHYSFEWDDKNPLVHLDGKNNDKLRHSAAAYRFIGTEDDNKQWNENYNKERSDWSKQIVEELKQVPTFTLPNQVKRMKFGGMKEDKVFKLKGGMAIPLDDKKRLFYLSGAKHEQGGIDVTPELEAEGGEVVKINPKSIKVVTAQKIMGGKSPAELVVDASSTGKSEKVFNRVFDYQEDFKDRNNLNDDGTKKSKFNKNKATIGTEEQIDSTSNKILKLVDNKSKESNDNKFKNFTNNIKQFVKDIIYPSRPKIRYSEPIKENIDYTYLPESSSFNNDNDVFPSDTIWTTHKRTSDSESVKNGAKLLNDKTAMVLHHTANFDPQSTINSFTNDNINDASAHVMIDTSGRRTVFAEPEDITFHAGKNTVWRSNGNWNTNPNDYSIGVEFVGDTSKTPLTDKQIDSFIEYALPILQKNNIPLEDIVSHKQLSEMYDKVLKDNNIDFNNSGLYKIDISDHDLERIKNKLKPYYMNSNVTSKNKAFLGINDDKLPKIELKPNLIGKAVQQTSNNDLAVPREPIKIINTNKLGLTPFDWINTGVNALGTLLNFGHALGNAEVPALIHSDPIPYTASKLNTKVNINDAKNKIRRATDEIIDSINKNTADSSVARNAIRNAKLRERDALIDLYVNKENRENELINKDTLNQQFARFKTIADANAISKENEKNKYLAKLQTQENINNAISGLTQNLAGITTNIGNTLEQRNQFDKNLKVLGLTYPDLDVNKLNEVIYGDNTKSTKIKTSKEEKRTQKERERILYNARKNKIKMIRKGLIKPEDI